MCLSFPESTIDCVVLKSKECALDAKGCSVLICDSDRPKNIVCSKTLGVLRKLDRWAMEGGIHLCGSVLLITAQKLQKRYEKKTAEQAKSNGRDLRSRSPVIRTGCIDRDDETILLR